MGKLRGFKESADEGIMSTDGRAVLVFGTFVCVETSVPCSESYSSFGYLVI